MTCDLNPGVSPLHRLDPRLKIAAAAAWSFLAATAQTFPAALFCLAGSLAFAALGRLAPAATLRRLAAVNFFLVFIWLFMPFSFSVPGETVLAWGFLEVTRPGLELALKLTLKTNATALGALAFFGTSPVVQLAAAARRLGAPEKLTAIFLLMLRYFHVISQEYARLSQALKARGFRPGLNRHTCRTYANLVGLLLVRGVDRAGRVHAAMLCRGYTGRFWFHDHFRLTRLDGLWAGLMAALLSGGVALNVL